MFFIPKILVTLPTRPRKTGFISYVYPLARRLFHMYCPACRKMPPRGHRPAIVCWLRIAAKERKGYVSAHASWCHHRCDYADGGGLAECHPRGRRSAESGGTRLRE